ncbi:MAG: ABC transporter permease [Actinobacteria bacterium 13_1_20CM_2_65_11]|nr:MAG: ABC transporter permease [Chloroflexi bacterium 13_1_40CM_65_17]OLD25375.1 MAG: ABC transporter permease [Chloroflexi bacterium 13_1_40CM_3_65_12]OLD49272.1 MAG: ABC transporter permease [Actinobacteria bacterium 13_1_40CM_2_65_8]OLE80619.1 MAG: ABC transporter permease [Actinobacteria bacterium 13_1_20CM_2_65_11]
MMGGRRVSLDWIGAVPFLVYVAVFLFLPTVIIAAGAFAGANGLTLSNFANLSRPYIVTATVNSLILSAVTAVAGAVLGALLAYAIATGNPRGVFRRVVTSACGVLAQFGGVTLAFAFIATIGPAGFIYVWMLQHHLDFYSGGVWLYDLRGLELVYLYFQIPLMVLVFLPAVDGIRPQWREATQSLGGSTWDYWRHIAGPLLAPAFLGSTLLLFANALSAYATAAALINQGGPILPLQISNAITSEVGLHEPGFAKAQAVVLIVIVAIVTALYALLQRRTARWLQ